MTSEIDDDLLAVEVASSVLGETIRVAAHPDALDEPGDLVTYTPREVMQLCGIYGQPEALQTAHLAKRITGGKVLAVIEPWARQTHPLAAHRHVRWDADD